MKYLGIIFALFFTLGVVSCGDDEETSCMAGAVQYCPCSGGLMGAQMCDSSGDSWGSCQCETTGNDELSGMLTGHDSEETSTSDTIEISGTTPDGRGDSGTISITNEQSGGSESIALSVEDDGSYSETISITEGENTITVAAFEGGTAIVEVTIVITYTPQAGWGDTDSDSDTDADSDTATGSEAVPANYGAPCHCTGTDCDNMGVPALHGGNSTIEGCENMDPAASSEPVCLRSYVGDLASDTYFANGYCAHMASVCQGDSAICDEASFGDPSAMACPQGTVVLEYSEDVTVATFSATIYNKICVKSCSGGTGECREGETDPSLDDEMTQYTCIDKDGVHFCYDPRNLGAEYTATSL